jgi:hypothetical protein
VGNAVLVEVLDCAEQLQEDHLCLALGKLLLVDDAVKELAALGAGGAGSWSARRMKGGGVVRTRHKQESKARQRWRDSSRTRHGSSETQTNKTSTHGHGTQS